MRVAIWLMALAALAATLLGIVPMRYLASLLSEDGHLADEQIRLLNTSQLSLTALLALSLAPGIFDGIWRSMRACWNWTLGLSLARFASATAMLAGVAGYAVQAFVFDGIPHVTDAVSQHFQAKILALGLWTAPTPPCPEFFIQYNVNMLDGSRWFSKYFLGHSLWLAAWMKVGAEILALPVAHAVGTACLAYIGEKVSERTVSRPATLLFVLSPLALLLSGSFMSHTTFLMYGLLAAALWIHANAREEAGRSSHAAFAGMGMAAGLCMITRPQDAPALAIPLLMVFYFLRGSGLRRTMAGLPSIILGALLPLAFQAAGNKAMLGSFLGSGYDLALLNPLSPKMSPAMGFIGGYTVAAAIDQGLWTLLRFNKVLFGWPSSLAPLLFLVLGGRLNRVEATCLVATLCVPAWYFFYSYYGLEYEARYYSMALPFVVILVASSLRRGFVAFQAGRGPAPKSDTAAAVLAILLVVSTVHGLVHYWPQYIWPRYSGAYEGADAGLSKAVSAAGISKAVVLYGSPDPQDLRYSSGFVFNDPLLRGNVIYGRSLERSALECLARAFEGRTVFRAVIGSDGSYSFRKE